MIKLVSGMTVILVMVLAVAGCGKMETQASQPTKSACPASPAMANCPTCGVSFASGELSACPVTTGTVKAASCPASSEGRKRGHPGTRPAPTAAAVFVGEVVETMDAAGYTYVNVASGTNQIWAASPRFEVKKGDKVSVPFEMTAPNFKSSTLNRTFDCLYMSSAIAIVEKAKASE